ncbi:glycosyltransferase family 4 protein [Chitinophaga sp. XS-30]|uniref:glycosyltransferase family 4 protein n=1 Tax=Chitinophaga sp. XS-30 TaxID=2604421 RepID=UPI0011DE0BB1|nr:glycosyltransferase family 4 protein [Chitinophaga sp. XS-30]QEH42076.1 glycosyltransferase family 4 protein [Chitinophaga sp. XS-30]
MKIAILSPVAWRTPPLHYGPWEQMASNVAEGLESHGHEVTLYATSNSHTHGTLKSLYADGYEEDKNQDAKVMECMHISYLMEQAGDYDIIHNHFDFLPLTYSRLVKTPVVTTIHGFSSQKIIPVYERYNDIGHYVSISNSDRSPHLRYTATVYNGIDPDSFDFCETPEDYLLFFGRMHPDKGPCDAIEIAKANKMRLIMAGIIQDESYYHEKVQPLIDGEQIQYIGPAGPVERNTLLGKAKALLHPVHFDEPFGLSVAEAMMCGTPVIAYRRGSMPELVRDCETGFLASGLKDAIERVDQLHDISRKTCREWAMSQFSMQKMVGDYVKVYEQVLHRS